MKYRVYNEQNYSERTGNYFATYFKTKKEAIAFAGQIGNATVERKCANTWVKCWGDKPRESKNKLLKTVYFFLLKTIDK